MRFPLGIIGLLDAKAHELKVGQSALIHRYVEEGLGVNAVGPVEAKVRADVEALVSTHPMGEALAAVAFRLAREIDYGNAFALASLSKELRAVLDDLAAEEDGGDDDDDDLLPPLFDSPESG